MAASHSSTSARLQAWQRDGGQLDARSGRHVTAWLGTGGIGHDERAVERHDPRAASRSPRRSVANPTLARRCRTGRPRPADWWISQPGTLYNTEQHCSTNCPFAQGDPNEHLYYATPYYEYAVVIDYNRHPVVQGAGSAFFLHVTVGEPTQGCVSIDRDQLVRILRWLEPSQHPRILMGVG